jgi:hypothetical protein
VNLGQKVENSVTELRGWNEISKLLPADKISVIEFSEDFSDALGSLLVEWELDLPIEMGIRQLSLSFSNIVGCVEDHEIATFVGGFYDNLFGIPNNLKRLSFRGRDVVGILDFPREIDLVKRFKERMQRVPVIQVEAAGVLAMERIWLVSSAVPGVEVFEQSLHDDALLEYPDGVGEQSAVLEGGRGDEVLAPAQDAEFQMTEMSAAKIHHLG